MARNSYDLSVTLWRDVSEKERKENGYSSRKMVRTDVPINLWGLACEGNNRVEMIKQDTKRLGLVEYTSSSESSSESDDESSSSPMDLDVSSNESDDDDDDSLLDLSDEQDKTSERDIPDSEKEKVLQADVFSCRYPFEMAGIAIEELFAAIDPSLSGQVDQARKKRLDKYVLYYGPPKTNSISIDRFYPMRLEERSMAERRSPQRNISRILPLHLLPNYLFGLSPSFGYTKYYNGLSAICVPLMKEINKVVVETQDECLEKQCDQFRKNYLDCAAICERQSDLAAYVDKSTDYVSNLVDDHVRNVRFIKEHTYDAENQSEFVDFVRGLKRKLSEVESKLESQDKDMKILKKELKSIKCNKKQRKK